MRKNIFYCSPNKSMYFTWRDGKTATLYSIANSVFMLEKRIKDGKTIPKEVVLNNYCELTSSVKEKISELLNILMLDILCEDVRFIFEYKDIKKTKEKLKEEDPRKFTKKETVCLFSGGVDSTIGILNSKQFFGEIIGIYVAHQDMGRITNLVKKVKKNLLEPSDIKIETFLAPSMGTGYSQTRGFLYVIYAGILSYYCDSNKIIISECGATMYQPKFSPFDTITYTTHPYVLQISKTILELIIGREIKLITPFENLTKSEVIKLLPNDSILSNTHSCITSRWGVNCGTCYACLTRMIGSINNDLSIDYFRANTFERASNENLSALLNFCFNFIFDRVEIDYWSLQTIKRFKKIELFERACEEVFLALNKLKSLEKLHSNYEFILDDFIQEGGERLTKREKELKSIKVEPDYNKIVPQFNGNIK